MLSSNLAFPKVMASQRTFTPLVTNRVLVTTFPSLRVNLTQEQKPEVKWFTYFC